MTMSEKIIKKNTWRKFDHSVKQNYVKLGKMCQILQKCCVPTTNAKFDKKIQYLAKNHKKNQNSTVNIFMVFKIKNKN